MKTFLLAALACLCFVIGARADSSFVYSNAFFTRYPTADAAYRAKSCLICHVSSFPLSGNASTQVRNVYGTNFSNARTGGGVILTPSQAFAAIENIDSDRDGFLNLFEIQNLKLPGNAADFPDVVQPSVSISSPASGTTYTVAQTVVLTASASDNVGVTRVEFYDSGVFKGQDVSAPFTYNWTVNASQNGPPHSWRAVAFDAAGNSAQSAVVTLNVNIDVGAPSVFISDPAPGTTFIDPQTVTLEAIALDSSGVSRVEFYQGGVLRGTDFTDTYSHDWTFTSDDNDTYSWTARAYDPSGNFATSVPVNLIVNIDISPPTVTITSPPNGTILASGQSVVLTALGVDNVGVTRVEFFLDGASVGTVTSPPFNFVWSVLPVGAHSWTARAFDRRNNASALSPAVTYTVQDKAPTFLSSPPAFQIVTAPTNFFLLSTPSGSEPMRFQWYFKKKRLLNATNASLVVRGAALTNSGPYYIVATNRFGRAISQVATVQVVLPVIFKKQPVSVTKTAGKPVVFKVMVTGTKPLRYQWYYDVFPIPGATNATYRIPRVADTNAGLYSVEISNIAGKFTSQAALLTVTNAALAASPLALTRLNDTPASVRLAIEPAGTDRVSLAFTGRPGHRYALQRSADLLVWETVQIVVGNDPAETRLTQPRHGESQMFYRIVRVE